MYSCGKDQRQHKYQRKLEFSRPIAKLKRINSAVAIFREYNRVSKHLTSINQIGLARKQNKFNKINDRKLGTVVQIFYLLNKKRKILKK